MAIKPIKKFKRAAGTQPAVPSASTSPRKRGVPTLNAPTPAAQSRSDSNRNEDGTYKVGKNKPPLHSRWPKGTSGNPKGPLKKDKLPDLDDAIIKLMLIDKVPVNTREGRKMKSLAEALNLKVSELGAKGQLKAIEYLFGRLAGALERKAKSEAPDATLSEAEAEVLRTIFRKFDFGDDDEGEPA